MIGVGMTAVRPGAYIVGSLIGLALPVAGLCAAFGVIGTGG